MPGQNYCKVFNFRVSTSVQGIMVWDWRIFFWYIGRRISVICYNMLSCKSIRSCHTAATSLPLQQEYSRLLSTACFAHWSPVHCVLWCTMWGAPLND